MEWDLQTWDALHSYLTAPSFHPGHHFHLEHHFHLDHYSHFLFPILPILTARPFEPPEAVVTAPIFLPALLYHRNKWKLALLPPNLPYCKPARNEGLRLWPTPHILPFPWSRNWSAAPISPPSSRPILGGWPTSWQLTISWQSVISWWIWISRQSISCKPTSIMSLNKLMVETIVTYCNQMEGNLTLIACN